MSFRREKYIPHGGPSGGDGGDGGSVTLIASSHLQTLYDFRYRKHFNAENGHPGEGKNRYGKKGEDIIIHVPCGTVVTIKDITPPPLDTQPTTPSPSRRSPAKIHVTPSTIVFDLITPGQALLIAKGGRGGLGNARFSTSTNQAPRYAQKGTPGEAKEIEFELKLIADVGIIGCPNAGKSTLLAHLTAAKPKIANYPFTTLQPNLGVLELEDRFVTLADIPGLIEGAHQGKGLGDEFLRHIERTKLLLHVVDLSAEDPLHDFKTINLELKKHSAALAKKDQIIVLNKSDIPGTIEKKSLFKRKTPLVMISAATGEGLAELRAVLSSALPRHTLTASEAEAVDSSLHAPGHAPCA